MGRSQRSQDATKCQKESARIPRGDATKFLRMRRNIKRQVQGMPRCDGIFEDAMTELKMRRRNERHTFIASLSFEYFVASRIWVDDKKMMKPSST
jgi:hypothetical protein